MIKSISAKETYLVRHPVLRNGKPIGSCHFDGDNLPTTRHYGYFENGQLAGIASVFASRNDDFVAANQWQLRGMAVLPNHQKKGFGDQLVQFAEADARNANIDLIWFNAREIAVGFYRKLGYEIWGDPFEIGDIGSHFIMFKKL